MMLILTLLSLKVLVSSRMASMSNLIGTRPSTPLSLVLVLVWSGGGGPSAWTRTRPSKIMVVKITRPGETPTLSTSGMLGAIWDLRQEVHSQ